MICLLGDIHGMPHALSNAASLASNKNATALIQVGDFGLFPQNADAFRSVAQQSSIPIYFIDGNHDHCTKWGQYSEITKLWDDSNLFYVPRGLVLEIDNKTIAFMGGAASIDKDIRLRENMYWDMYENISQKEVDRFIENVKGKNIDMFVTHAPPLSVVNKNFNPTNKLWFGVGIDWEDPNMAIVENLWSMMGFPMIYSGHMHKRTVGHNYRILAENEIIFA